MLLLLVPLFVTQSTSQQKYEIRIMKQPRDAHEITVTYRTGNGERGTRTGQAPFEIKLSGRSLELDARQVSGTGEFTVEVLAGDKYSGQGTARCAVHVEADRNGIQIRAGASVCDLLRKVNATD